MFGTRQRVHGSGKVSRKSGSLFQFSNIDIAALAGVRLAIRFDHPVRGRILHLDLGGNTLNLLGFNVSTTPVTIDLSGDSAGPLGNLVCQALALLNNVAGLVGILNQLLGLVTGLLGGLTGGLGG